MSNACGFFCCASDEFGKCGCEHCPEPACWPDEEEFEDDLDIEEWPLAAVPVEAVRCRRCGCTYSDACVTEHGSCHWVAPELCSACVGGTAS